LDGAVEKAVVSMKMEVYELTVLHYLCCLCNLWLKLIPTQLLMVVWN
jgi:hypothetical protein